MVNNLKDTVTFRHGAKINGRLYMPPMLTSSGTKDGFATDDTLNYYSHRSKAAGMLITEYHYVSENGGPSAGGKYGWQLGIYDDAHTDSIKKLAKVMKQDGSKAILQINHGGREANGFAKKAGFALAPSQIDFPWLDYPVKELSNDQIEAIIQDFGKATKRAIDAGFDGIEIHGANHYLLQQFFSKYSNRRTDKWGGSLEKRMAFPLAVTKEVLRVVKKYAPADFIVGYRISPEEIHGANVGYTIKESAQLVKALNQFDLDYLHVSIFGRYSDGAKGSNQSYTQVYRQILDDQIKILAVGGVFSAEDAQRAVSTYTDLVGIGRGSLIDPLFGDKVMHGDEDQIVNEISPEQLKKTNWTKGLMASFTKKGQNGLPPLPNGQSIQK